MQSPYRNSPMDDAEVPMPGPLAAPQSADKGGAKMGGGLGPGVETQDYGDAGEAGYKCEGSFPLTGEFWTRDPEHGQA